jgi:hypothetical protein
MKDHVINIKSQTSIHLNIHPSIKPSNIFQEGMGDTNNSSIDFWNFAQKNEPDVFP